MSIEAEVGAEPAAAGSAKKAAAAQASAVLSAGMGLFASLRRVATAVLALFMAEAEVLRASLALIFLACIALVAFAVSLWVCVVALIGWALTVATHSVGIALVILVGLHMALVGGLWLAIRNAVLQFTFPRTRAELLALRQDIRRDMAKFQHASASTEREPAP